MNEDIQVKVARLEEKVVSLDDKVKAGLTAIDSRFNGQDSKLAEIQQSLAKLVTKDEYQRDIEREKMSRAPWLKIAFTVLQNLLNIISGGLILYFLTNASKIFR